MNREISVDCTFKADGSVLIRRLKINQNWLVVEPGRQWLDRDGRHVLVMIPGQGVRELLLRGDTLRWEMAAQPSGPPIA